MILQLTGILSRELSLKTDKNGNDYYHGWLKIKDGSIHAFFFFDPDYDLGMRLTELEINQKLTLQGVWSKRNLRVFLANDFCLEEKEESFGFERFSF